MTHAQAKESSEQAGEKGCLKITQFGVQYVTHADACHHNLLHCFTLSGKLGDLAAQALAFLVIDDDGSSCARVLEEQRLRHKRAVASNCKDCAAGELGR